MVLAYSISTDYCDTKRKIINAYINRLFRFLLCVYLKRIWGILMLLAAFSCFFILWKLFNFLLNLALTFFMAKLAKCLGMNSKSLVFVKTFSKAIQFSMSTLLLPTIVYAYCGVFSGFFITVFSYIPLCSNNRRSGRECIGHMSIRIALLLKNFVWYFVCTDQWLLWQHTQQ